MAKQSRHWFKTKLKHRLKLNDKYNPKRWVRVSFRETYSSPFADFLRRWAEHVMKDD